MFPDLTWDQVNVQLDQSSVLVVYSDGITEAQDPEQGFFEEHRLIEAAGANLGRSARDIEEAILARVNEFTGKAPQSDDITLLVVVRE
jgi:sigma-B regulation protein RsbU (phosphoserine phosphatase)